MNDTNGTDNIVCREGFIKTDLICEPRCDGFEQTSHLNSQILIYSEVVATSMGLIFCTATIVVAVKEYKKSLVTYKYSLIILYHCRLVYPSVLVFFQVIDLIVLGKVHCNR